MDELEVVLTELKSLVKYYNKLANPKNESDKQIRVQLEYINRLEINVAFPFLMKIYEDLSNEIIDKTLNVNLKGSMYTCRAAIPHMLKHKNGSLVNISSVNGIVSEPFLTVYSASKGGVVMLTKGIALDYAKLGIRCNATIVVINRVIGSCFKIDHS